MLAVASDIGNYNVAHPASALFYAAVVARF
jgi:hypothetical protein